MIEAREMVLVDKEYVENLIAESKEHVDCKEGINAGIQYALRLLGLWPEEKVVEMKGTAKCWLDKRKFGYIIGADGLDYFVHWSEILTESRQKELKAGQHVTFDAIKDEKGWKAVGVVPDNDGMEGR